MFKFKFNALEQKLLGTYFIILIPVSWAIIFVKSFKYPHHFLELKNSNTKNSEGTIGFGSTSIFFLFILAVILFHFPFFLSLLQHLRMVDGSAWGGELSPSHSDPGGDQQQQGPAGQLQ